MPGSLVQPSHDSDRPADRKVSPLIAALLSILGWGLGHYYAGRPRAAVLAAASSYLVAIGLFLTVAVYAYSTRSLPRALLSPDAISGVDFLHLIGALVVAALAWRTAKTSAANGVSRTRPKALGYALIWLLPIAASAVTAILVRTIYHPFEIPNPAMLPTIEPGDFVVAEKRAYGARSYSLAPLRGLPDVKRPDRGDIAVFARPGDTKEKRIGRVIGLPGDVIAMQDGTITLNGIAIRREKIGLKESAFWGGSSVVTLFRETLPNSVSYTIADAGEYPQDTFLPITVPEDAYFMLGDNRDRATDSRDMLNVGFVPHENLVGRVRFIARQSAQAASEPPTN